MPDLVLERVFDAPRELVWRAFTDPDQLAAWFGPEGYTVPRESVSIDLRVGGRQKFVMVATSEELPPGGPVSGTFEVVDPPSLLVCSEDLTGDVAEFFGSTRITLRLELHDEDGRTRLVLHQGPYGEHMIRNATMGWTSSFTKLDAFLAGQPVA